MLRKLMSYYRLVVLGRPKVTVVVVLLIVAGLAAGLPHLKLDASADSLTLENDQDVDFFREINSRYQTGDFLVITYTPEADLFSDEALETLKQLRDDLLDVDGVAGANSILDVPLLYSPLQSMEDVMEGQRTLMDPGVDREAAKQEFHESPIYRDMILGPEGQTTAIQLNLEVDNKFIDLVRRRDELREKRQEEGLTDQEAEELEQVSEEFLAYRTQKDQADRERIATIREITDDYKDEAEIFIGGVSMIAADMITFIKNDLMVFGAIIIVFVLATLLFIFRQPRFVFLPFLICTLTVTLMLGFLGWVDWRITVISNNFVSLLFILTLALNIHLVVRYRELHKKYTELDQRELVLKTVRQMALPCLYTALTTIVAFVSLVVSDIQPVMDFGWMMTLGLVTAFVLSFVLLPASLALLPRGEVKDRADNSHAVTRPFSRFTENHGSWVLAVAVLAAVLSVYGISKLEVENRPIDYFHESTEIYQGMTVIDRNLGGTTTLDIILDVPQAPETEESLEDDPFADPSEGASEEDPFADPGEGAGEDDPFAVDDDPFGEEDPFASDQSQELKESYWFTVTGLEEIEALHDYLRDLPEVGKVQSLAIAYKVVEDIYRGPLNDFELAVLQQDLPEDVRKLLVDPYLSYEANQARIALRVKETSPELDRSRITDKIQRHAVNELGFEEEQVHFTGLLVLYNNMLDSLFKSQIVTLGAVFLGIMVMFLLLFRSFTFSVVAIVPNLLAAGSVLGSMGLMGIPLDLMNIMVAAITVGMGVDHAIHYIHRFKQEFEVDQNYVNAMHRAHSSIGRAMFYTAVTIIVGFSVLVLSEFIPSIYFGMLTSLAMFVAIVGSLTLLPRLILLTKPLGEGNAGGE